MPCFPSPKAIPAPTEIIAINGWSDLSKFGIEMLTGEACAYSQRVLCDVNESGRAMLAEFLGVPELQLAPPMNSTVDGKPTIGCIMLERSAWRGIARFAMFRDRAIAYRENPTGGIIGLYTQQIVDQYSAILEGGLVHNHSLSSTAPAVGSRNVHQFTGRIL